MNINLDYLTSEWSWTPVFKRVAYFDICSLITLFLGSDTKNGKNFFAIRPITWNFDTATHIQGTTIWNLSSWQSSKNNGFLSTPFWPAWTEKRKSILLKKDSITVGCHRKTMTMIPQRTCVDKAIIGKIIEQIIVSFAVLDFQLVIQFDW